MTDDADRYDVVVIGAGPGGYVGAIRAAQLGLRTAVVEKAEVGGVCLNWGCIPSKALLYNAEVLNLFNRAGDYGIAVEDLSADYSHAVKRSRRIARRFEKGVEFLFRRNDIDLIRGVGRLAGRNTVHVTGETETEVEGDNVIVATGSGARVLPGMEVDGEQVLTSREAIVLDEVPDSIVIIGAGYIGMEFGYIYKAYGSDVTILEMMPQVLPTEDAEVAQELEKSFAKRGINIKTEARVEGVDLNGDAVMVHVSTEDGEEDVEAEKVLVAVGRAPDNSDLGLEEIGVEIDDQGFIVVDEHFRTSADGVYAVGDVVGGPLLAHKGMREGVIAAEAIAGQDPQPISYDNVPSCVYCQPQVASIGMTEEEAREAGYDLKIGKFPFEVNGKARGTGHTEGFVKFVVDARYGEILGAHIVGHEATELIHEVGLAKTFEFTPAEVEWAIHAHPTFSEAIAEAALDVEDMAIHI